MVVVRYVALAALVIWLGALQTALIGDRSPQVATVEIVCGGAILPALLTMKFLGPPPRAFSVRLTIVVAMLALGAFDRVYGSWRVTTVTTTALGFGLLFWYARE